MRRAEPWTIADLLDFEYLLAADAEGDEAAVRARDRAIFDERIAATLSPTVIADRRAIFHRWLNARRGEAHSALPGESFQTGWQSLLSLAILAGLIIGGSLTAGLLHYRGDEPVNVAWFLAATVGVQWVLLVAALMWWLIRHTTRLFEKFRPVRALLGALLWALSGGLRRLPGEQRERFRAILATVRHRRTIYGSLAAWPLLIVTQIFGIFFNLGILATLLLQVSLSDVAFGWQSTLNTSPAEAFRFVSTLATPWTILPNPHPSFDQIVASRFAYSAGIRPLSQAAMTSWWPFLCYAVAVYGLLVRALILAWSSVGLNRALRSISFDHQGCNALARRLTGPVFRAQSETAALKIPIAPETQPVRMAGASIALLAEELSVEAATLANFLGANFAWQLHKMLAVQIDHPSGNSTMWQELVHAPRLAGVVIGIPARRAPIKAIALFLQKIIAASAGAETVILLFGHREDGGFAPVSDEEFAHWKNFNAIHGLHLGLEKWRPK